MIKLKLESLRRVVDTFLRWRRQNLEDFIHASDSQLSVLLSELNVGLELLHLNLDRRNLFKHLTTMNSSKKRARHNVKQTGGLIEVRGNNVICQLT